MPNYYDICLYENVIIKSSHVIEIFEINILDQLFNVFCLRKTFLTRTIVNLSMRTINPEQSLELKLILIAKKDAFMLRRRICMI